MILYVNGDSNSAGAEAVNSYCFAEDDPLYWGLGRQPHPDNLRVSYGCELANLIGAVLECGAESASSNARIIRTTQEYLKEHTPDLIIIGWSTWEREEWLHEGTYYQVTASGQDSVPPVFAERYRDYVLQQDFITREAKMLEWHKRIFQLHQELNERDIPHVFFNCYSDFGAIKRSEITTHNTATPAYEWGDSYVEPYNQNMAYYYWLQNSGFKTVNPKSYHFGADAHSAWANFLYQNYIQKLLTS